MDILRANLAGSSELLKKLEHTSIVKGDGTGYDIYYKGIGNVDRYVEVKTTTGANPLASIVMTENEVSFSRENPDNYELYMIYNLNVKAKTYEVIVKKGSVEENFGLLSKSYSLLKK